MAEPLLAMFIGAATHRPIQAVSSHNPSKLFEKVEGKEQEAHSGSAENASKAASQVNLSDEAKAALALRETQAEEPLSPVGDSKEDTSELTDEEKQQVAELKTRDAEVRAHERAHVAAAGGHTKGGIKYETQRGPDNKEYAVGGHVSIDTAPIEGDPEQTIRKAETVRRAALAPAEPSGADRGVASAAANTMRAARAELAEAARAKLEESDGKSDEAQIAGAQESEDGLSNSSVRSSYAVAAYGKAAA